MRELRSPLNVAIDWVCEWGVLVCSIGLETYFDEREPSALLRTRQLLIYAF